MKPVHAKRLLKLADVLETVPRRRFDFTEWCSGENLNECGTVACSLGWATTVPAFRRLGLRMHHGLPSMQADQTGPSDVAEQIFGLDYEDYRHLFVEGLPNEATPKQAAKHVRAFVKRTALTKGSAR